MDAEKLIGELTPRRARKLLGECREWWTITERQLLEHPGPNEFLRLVNLRETLASLIIKLHEIASAPTPDAGLYLVH